MDTVSHHWCQKLQSVEHLGLVLAHNSWTTPLHLFSSDLKGDKQTNKLHSGKMEFRAPSKYWKEFGSKNGYHVGLQEMWRLKQAQIHSISVTKATPRIGGYLALLHSCHDPTFLKLWFPAVRDCFLLEKLVLVETYCCFFQAQLTEAAVPSVTLAEFDSSP